MCPAALKAVIFDFDDTLVDTYAFFCHQLHQTLIELYGPDYDHNYMVTAEMFYNQNMPFVEIFKKTFGENSGKTLRGYREKSSSAQYQAKPGMLDFVNFLVQQNIDRLILSNRTKLIKYRLTQAGFDPCQFRIFHAENKKPHPHAYAEVFKCLKHLGIKAEETIIIGNHPDDFLALPDLYKAESLFIALPINHQARKNFQKINEKAQQKIQVYNHISELSNIYGRIF